jgi:hypothetical protein
LWKTSEKKFSFSRLRERKIDEIQNLNARYGLSKNDNFRTKVNGREGEEQSGIIMIKLVITRGIRNNRAHRAENQHFQFR